METRDIKWIDEKRVPGNPDCIVLEIDGAITELKLQRIENGNLICFSDSKLNYRVFNDFKYEVLDD